MIPTDSASCSKYSTVSGSAAQRCRNEIDRSFGALLKQLPNKSEVEALLVEITQAGLGRGLQFELFKPGQVKLHDYYAELPIEIKLTGNYHALAGFASDIANLQRIVTLDRVAIIQLRDGLQSFEGVIHTFRYLNKEEIALQKKRAEENKNRGGR